MKRVFREFFLTLPSFGWLFCFFFIPACIVYTIAFKATDETGVVLPQWTLESIKSLFEPEIVALTWRTLWLSMTTTVICVIIAIPLAYYMASAPLTRQRKLLLLVVIPLWSSFLVRIFAWKVVLHPEGPVKFLLTSCGFIHEATPLLYNNAAVLIVMVYSNFPFAVLPLYSAASKFDFSLFEAALDLGASKGRAFFSIFLPVMIPAMLTACLMVLIPAAGAYVIPEIVGGGSSEMLGNTIARRVFVDRNLPDASALSLLLSLVIFIPAIFIVIYKASAYSSKAKGYS